MDSPSNVENAEPQVVFRPSKKRKQFRQRAGDSEITADEATNSAAAPPKSAQDTDAKLPDGDDGDGEGSEIEGISVAEALRLRNARRSRLKGVEFRAQGAPKVAADEDLGRQSLLSKDDDAQDGVEFGMSRRFAPQAGLVGELVNRHM